MNSKLTLQNFSSYNLIKAMFYFYEFKLNLHNCKHPVCVHMMNSMLMFIATQHQYHCITQNILEESAIHPVLHTRA